MSVASLVLVASLKFHYQIMNTLAAAKLIPCPLVDTEPATTKFALDN